MKEFDCTKPLYIIGDVHGCYESLCVLIEKLPNKWDSQIIFVGDLIDRGRRSCEVVELVIKNNYSCILGNHEELMLEYYNALPNKERKNIWVSNGGYATMESYKENGGLYKIHEHLDWFLTLPRFLEIDYCDKYGLKLFVTHGFGLPFYKERYTEQKALTWSRLKMFNVKKEAEKYYGVFNVFGHDVQKNGILMMDNFAAIDTGCVYYNKLDNASLTALEWPTKHIFQEKCNKRDLWG